jgi:MoaA/NifB/PqqE/SkfB family radical SAM enzyme
LLVGTSTFEKTIQGIKNAIAAGLNVSVNTPLCSLNKDYLSLVKYLHEELGVNYFTCSGIIITGNATNEDSVHTQLTEDELINILRELKEYEKETSIGINFTSPGWVDGIKLRQLGYSIPTCGACLSNMGIAPDGTVVPCQSWLTDTHIGNLLQDDWKTIWKHQECVKIRKMHKKKMNVCFLNEKGGKK